MDDGSFNNGYIYRTGLNKKDWLYNCLCNEINTTKSLNKVYDFLEKAFNPVSFTEESKREKYHTLLEKVNKVLLMAGLNINNEGKIKQVEVARIEE